MKFAVIIALASSASAAVAGGCATDFADIAANASATGNADCSCAADCTICKGAAGSSGTPTVAGAGDCFTCKVATATMTPAAATPTAKFGTCVAKAGTDAAAGKAIEGADCDGDGDNKGCAEGLQCGKTEKVEADAAKSIAGNAASEVCVKTENCKAPITCGAFKLGASLAAAFAIANYM
jgi:hypothetical protein